MAKQPQLVISGFRRSVTMREVSPDFHIKVNSMLCGGNLQSQRGGDVFPFCVLAGLQSM